MCKPPSVNSGVHTFCNRWRSKVLTLELTLQIMMRLQENKAVSGSTNSSLGVSNDFWSCKSINSRVNIVCDNEKPLNFKLPGPSPRLQSKPRHASRCGLQRTLLGAVQLCKCSLVLDLQKTWQVFLTRSLDCSTTNDFQCFFDCVQLISSQFLPCIEVCSLLCTKCFCVSLVRLGRYD